MPTWTLFANALVRPQGFHPHVVWRFTGEVDGDLVLCLDEVTGAQRWWPLQDLVPVR